jgi:hypothetical protein
MGKGREVSVGKACKETSIALEGHFFCEIRDFNTQSGNMARDTRSSLVNILAEVEYHINQ